MGQTLTHGIYLPDEGERNCYNGLAANWQILDSSVGTIAEHTAALAGKAPLVHTHTKADITDFPAYGNSAGTICEGNDSRLSDARTPLSHTHTKSDITDFPALANVATSGSYNDLSNIPASFTPASHTHGNLTNDGKVGTTANKPLITGTDGVVQAGSFGNAANTFCEGNDSRLSDARTPVAHTHTKSDVTDLLNSNFIPSANNSYDLGSSSYQWNNLYAKGYYYNGVAWGLDKDNSWTNFNRFNGYRLTIKNPSQEIGVIPTSNQWNGFYFTDKNNNPAVSFEHAFMGSGETRFKISMVDNVASHDSGSTVWIEFLRLATYSGGSSFTVGADLRPSSNNFNLGTSTNKWKTLNGLNPGRLSFPDMTSTDVDIINTQSWNVSGGINTYTPLVDGWLHINIKDTATNSVFVYAAGSYAVSAYGNGSQNLDGRVAIIMPILAGVTYGVIIKAGSTSEIYSAKFIPCKGNV